MITIEFLKDQLISNIKKKPMESSLTLERTNLSKVIKSNLLKSRYYLLLKKGVAIYLNKCKSPSPNAAMCQVWLKLAQCTWRIRFLNVVHVLPLFHYYLNFRISVDLNLIRNKFSSPKNALCQVCIINLSK